MLKFYFNGSPNPTKVALLLEEAGLPYEAVPVDTRKGRQFAPEYLAINPNGKVPAIVGPAAARAQNLKDRHTFKTEMDDEARSHMFKHLARKVG